MQYDDGASQKSKPKISGSPRNLFRGVVEAKRPALQPVQLVSRLDGAKGVRLVFFGNERLATGLEHTNTPTLKALIDNGYDIAAVISNYSEGRSRNARKLEIAEVAAAHNIPVLLPTHLRDIKDDIKNLNADAGILVAYGKIIPKEIIDIFPGGIINIHPSLLPKYRGPTPVEQAILDGASETGTSIMRLVPEMDAGPVFDQGKINLSGNETKEQLANKLLDLGGELLINNLPSILDGSAMPMSQNEAEATYTQLLKKEDGVINWNKPADFIERQVRAFLSFPKSRANVLGKDIIITKSKTAKDKHDGQLVIQCNPGFLEIQELIAPSGRVISGSEFLRGYSSRN
jgi:methionyl-tRNA formyltransferase